MAEARPMFRNEVEFRRAFVRRALVAGMDDDDWGDLDEAYREGNPNFDYF